MRKITGKYPKAFYTVPTILSLLLSSGCGYVHFGTKPQIVEHKSDTQLAKDNEALLLERKMLQQELALTKSQGEALRFALSNRTADGDTSRRLVERLNQTTRELATLKFAYAKQQEEQSRYEPAEFKVKLKLTEEKLATTLRDYTKLQEEVVQLRSEIGVVRQENGVLTAEVKEIKTINLQAQLALNQLNNDLLSQKAARFKAEQDINTLSVALKEIAPNTSALALLRTGSAAEARTLLAEHAKETAGLQAQIETGRSAVATSELAREKAVSNLAVFVNDAVQLRAENTQLKIQLSQARQGLAGTTTNTTREFNSGLVTIKPIDTTLVVSTTKQPSKYHVICTGDTLAKISSKYYGTKDKWKDIAVANYDILGREGTLVEGYQLRIP